MTEKDIIKTVDSLTQDEKLKLWLKYMVEIVTLNNDYKVSEGKQSKGTYYPIMNLTTWKYMEGVAKHKVVPFDSWLKQDKNNHDLTGIYAYYRKINVYDKVKWNRYEDKNNIPKYKSIMAQPLQKISEKLSGCGYKNK